MNDLTKDDRYAAWRTTSYTDFAEAVERVERRTLRQAAGGAASGDDDDDDAEEVDGMAPMGMVPVRKNIVRVVIAVDASDVRQLPYIGIPDQLVRGKVPARAGRVLVPTDLAGELVVASYHHLLQAGGPRVAAQFLGGVLQLVEYTRGAPLTANLIELIYGQVAAAGGGRSGSAAYAASAAAALAADAAGGAGHVARARAWAARLGVGPGEPFPLLVTVNGVPQPDFLAEAVQSIVSEQAAFARLVRQGLITDSDSEVAAHALLMRHGRRGTGSTLVSRLPTALLPPDTSRMSRSSSSAEGGGEDAATPAAAAATVVAADGNGTASVPFAALVQDAAAMAELRSIRYVQAAHATADAAANGGSPPLPLLTLWLVGDLDSLMGAATAARMVTWVASPVDQCAARVRLALLHTGPPPVDDGPGAGLPLSGLSPSAVARLTGVHHTREGLAGMWANGRRLPAGAVADSTDFAALAAIERATRGDAVLAALTGKEDGGFDGQGEDTVGRCIAGTADAVVAADGDRLPCADVLLLALGVVAAAEEACAGVSQTAVSPAVVEALAPPASPLWVSVPPSAGWDAAVPAAVAVGGAADGTDTRWATTADPADPDANASTPATALWEVLAVVDPTAPSGPAAAALLTALRDALHPRLRLLLLPSVGSWDDTARMIEDDASENVAMGEGEDKDDAPSPFAGRVFTKYLLPGVSRFDQETGGRVSPAVVFRRLPPGRVLSLAVSPPRSWLVGVAAATRDLDNLLLTPAADGEPPVEEYAEYALESLLVEGSAADEMLSPPQGLRLRLDPMLPAAGGQAHGDDTLVMGNLGYFQLKAAMPGAWRLSLAPADGSGNTSAYGIVSIEGAGEGVGVVTADGTVAVVVDSLDGARGTLLRVTRRADAELPAAAGAAGGVRDKLKSLIGRVKRAGEVANGNDSGPPSGDTGNNEAAGEAEEEDRRIHVFSVASGHLYERLLKIMMLSVLMDLPLAGAPYGYVPFCNSRRDVDGFRFWNVGYWAGILGGRPYHISALYVVDLDVFRASRTGDTLRAVYQSLSADPNSLSNLDQDLPNYAAVTPASGLPGGPPLVRIFSLPQEWLWCDSWCDQASKAAAKTIDLCNNPLTKVPKLTAAKTIIPEWEEYDSAAAASTAAIYERLAHAVAVEEGGAAAGWVGGGNAAPPDAIPVDATADRVPAVEPPAVGGVGAPVPPVGGEVGGGGGSHDEL
ncbi:hypothetical protein I4F81_002752 [Pyropia yezoensis]|uniref:Uncharacterized protein n=1 Tax=Pyropia yezoensis TaxID=2788 RepID=A0ACC3BRD4_PYRYE|nr:hypothetical protein I4F81_002752 [Neopyropia yezoensis]